MVKTKSAAKGCMSFEKDQYGKEILLKDDALQVMMEWEKPYMAACIAALQPTGDVLEIGFGLGYSANEIQKFNPKSHTIIESDPAVLQKAKEWAKKHPKARIVEGLWQDQLASLGTFDAIFFDDYAPFTQAEVDQLRKDTKKYQKIAEDAQSLYEQLEETYEQFSELKFNDDDLKQFLSELKNRANTSAQQVISFIKSLAEKGNITKKQSEKFLKDFEKDAKNKPEAGFDNPLIRFNQKQLGDRFITFAELCLNMHMRPHARLSAYMGSPESKEKNPDFKQKILSRKDVKYTEKSIPIEVPPNCTYYQGNKALVIVIEKK